MKQERIEELLVGTPYSDKTKTVYEHVDVEARSYSYQTVIEGESLACKHGMLNAARVQLLAKALLYIKGNAEAAGGSEAVYMFPDDKRLEDYISEVLAEAGLDKEIT
jgi:hypothetical protein